MTDIEAPISQVTVFSDRAQITRRAAVHLEGGAQELVLSGLPTGIDENSLRASGAGTVAVKILGVESRERPLEKTPHQTTLDLMNELQKLGDESASLKKRREVIEQREKTIRALADSSATRFAKALAVGETSLEAAAQMLDFTQAQQQSINDRLFALVLEQRANDERQTLLQNRLAQWQANASASDHCVTVALESTGECDFELELIYTIGGARWEPFYDARVELSPPTSPDGTLEGKLQLSYLAKITQRTGEDWNDVALTLSTAQPHLGTLPPKLEPLYVDVAYRRSAPDFSKSKPRLMAGGSADDDFDDDLYRAMAAPQAPAATAPVQAQHETAIVEADISSVSYKLARRLKVPADGQPHRGTIAMHEFSIHLDYQAVPRRTEFAYLRATATNDSGLSFLAGQANIYRDGAFIGSAQLQQTAPNQELKLFLGPDEQVRAKRELAKREVDKNFMGNVRRQHNGYKIEVANLKPYRVELTVLDQVPVSRHEQIKVKPHHPEPQPETDDLGVMTWKLNLVAGKRIRVLG